MGSTSSTPSSPKKTSQHTVKQTSQHTVKKFSDEYLLGELLGEGAFGAVRVCTRRTDSEQFAVKTYRHGTIRTEVKREVDAMRRLSHANVVTLHGVFSDKGSLCLVMDKYRGDLIDGLEFHKEAGRRLSCHSIAHVCSQMADAIQYVHSLCIIHRDIKGDNVLVDRKDITELGCHIALTDFGTALVLKPDQRLHDKAGTQKCWSPEFFERDYGLKVDIWAMGVLVFGILAGHFPFRDEVAVKKQEPNWPELLHPDCEDYLKGMLEKCEQKRSSANEVVAHIWIRKKHQSHNQSHSRGAQAQSVDVKQHANTGTTPQTSPRECSSNVDVASHPKHCQVLRQAPNQVTHVQQQQEHGQIVRLRMAGYPYGKPGANLPTLLSGASSSRVSPHIPVGGKQFQGAQMAPSPEILKQRP